MRLNRDRLLIQLLCGGSLVVGCTRLTAVDWSLIPADASAGTSTGAMSAGGEGEPPGGEAGTATAGGAPGAAGEQAGGAAGAAGEDSGGTAGTGGTTGGFGGSAGGGAGGVSGHGGMAGSAGSGGNGGSGGSDPIVVFPPCTGTPSAIQPGDVVMFDGGVGTLGTPRGGRTGLDNSCKAALAKLSLTQTMTHAFISVSEQDSIFYLTQTFPDIPKDARVVGPTGIELQSAFSLLSEGKLEQSLVCAGALPMGTTTWLTGSTLACTGVLANECGRWGGDADSCNGWTFGQDDPLVLGRYGSARMTVSIGTKSWFSWLKETCTEAGTEHVVCFAYTP